MGPFILLNRTWKLSKEESKKSSGEKVKNKLRYFNFFYTESGDTRGVHAVHYEK